MKQLTRGLLVCACTSACAMSAFYGAMEIRQAVEKTKHKPFSPWVDLLAPFPENRTGA